MSFIKNFYGRVSWSWTPWSIFSEIGRVPIFGFLFFLMFAQMIGALLHAQWEEAACWLGISVLPYVGYWLQARREAQEEKR